MKNQKGFSLVELLIVVAIIGIIAAIAIPSLLAARRAANESSAIGNLRTYGSANATYQSTSGIVGDLANLRAKQLLDQNFTSGSTRSGYVLTEAGLSTTQGTFFFSANPGSTSQGTRYFCITEDYVIHFNPTGAASTADSALGS